jgi:chromosome segregation ATPase
MERLVPFLLLVLGLGALYLGLAGLIRLRPDRPEFWLFGLGVRSRVGAVKVLLVATALLFLSYTAYRKGSLTQMLQTPVSLDPQLYSRLTEKLQKSEETLEQYRADMAHLTREKEDCQSAVSRLGTGLANRNDVTGELRAALGIRKREIASFESTISRMRDEMARLQKEHEQVLLSYRETQDKVAQLGSQVRSLQTANAALDERLSQTNSQDEAELKRLREENGKLKGLNRDAERSNSLLRQGLVLRESNDWQLEQEIQQLANLLVSQPEVNAPRQGDISRAIQKITQVLREGSAVTKQARAADARPAQPKSTEQVKTP